MSSTNLQPSRLQPSRAEAIRASVHHGDRHWVLEPGQSVSFGRGSPCDIRIADDPLDEHVSRRAGVLECLGEDVVVRNVSTSRTLIFSPARGPERVIGPEEAITCRPHTEFLVGLPGRDGGHYVLQVTTATPPTDGPPLR
jgi:hypothetical protein